MSTSTRSTRPSLDQLEAGLNFLKAKGRLAAMLTGSPALANGLREFSAARAQSQVAKLQSAQ